MSHTISARQPEGFRVAVFDWAGNVAHEAWYSERVDAVAAATKWERLVTLCGAAKMPPLDEALSDDELLAELKA